ncbi:septation ring formation regulator EzrA [Neobacillus cucumis]|uniref:septation ring formation regulator EzrA n=1 Tax=Neobacillus cucumis TaxID=1740721 RepID=UPI002852F9DE|nr:septation ring formation regulator EzrA [Neobacillus cucumis]MDR4948872.1 septation ring formation regulator EzrA [Neobacillus cucumis]
MKYIIGFIILILALFVWGYLIKRKYFKEMDRLEAWKIDLLNRPILEEMSKVKKLNMTGQTEELFERWRNQWDDVVTVKLPDLEEMLFDAEEHTDRYRFKKAKEVQQSIEKKMQEIEDQIKNILDELHELVGSEEKNRVEIEELKDKYREAKKMLLAHRHSFGNSEKQLEQQLSDVAQKFQECDEKTELGNYLEAREVVLQIHSQLGKIKHHMDIIPQMLIECQSLLPNLLSDCLEGHREMIDQGYYLEHIGVENEIKRLEEKLVENHALIESAEIDQAEEGMKEVKDRIDVLFDLLEKEVHAKHFVFKNEQEAFELLDAAQNENRVLSSEFSAVQQSYQISDNDFETQRQLEKELTMVYKHFEILVEKLKMNETAQSVLCDELNAIKVQLDIIREGQQEFGLKLQALRKDEIEAREKVKELTKKLGETIRIVKKNNVPGLPANYQFLFEETNESIQNVRFQLEEKPLNVSALNQYLEVAVLTVDKLVMTTHELIENVTLAEKAIQYGNRYRSKNPSIAKSLEMAEEAFRHYDYQEALEQAAASLEGIDPEALKKIKAAITE